MKRNPKIYIQDIPAAIKKKHNKIPWKRMAGMRDKLIHEYFGVDPKILWDKAKQTCQQ